MERGKRSRKSEKRAHSQKAMKRILFDECCRSRDQCAFVSCKNKGRKNGSAFRPFVFACQTVLVNKTEGTDKFFPSQKKGRARFARDSGPPMAPPRTVFGRCLARARCAAGHRGEIF